MHSKRGRTRRAGGYQGFTGEDTRHSIRNTGKVGFHMAPSARRLKKKRSKAAATVREEQPEPEKPKEKQKMLQRPTERPTQM